MQPIIDALKNISGSQYWAVGRHFITAGGAVGLTLILKDGDASNVVVASLKSILDATQAILIQLGIIATGIATIMAVVSPLFAGKSASPKSQIEAVAANPEVKKVVTTEAVAEASPSAKVVSQ